MSLSARLSACRPDFGLSRRRRLGRSTALPSGGGLRSARPPSRRTATPTGAVPGSAHVGASWAAPRCRGSCCSEQPSHVVAGLARHGGRYLGGARRPIVAPGSDRRSNTAGRGRSAGRSTAAAGLVGRETAELSTEEGPGRRGVGRGEHRRCGRGAAVLGCGRRCPRPARLSGRQHPRRDDRPSIPAVPPFRLGRRPAGRRGQLAPRPAGRAAHDGHRAARGRIPHRRLVGVAPRRPAASQP